MDEKFYCPMCGMEREQEEEEYTCTQCGGVGYDCCIPGNNSICVQCEENDG